MHSKIPLSPAYTKKLRMREALFEPAQLLPVQERLLRSIGKYRYTDLIRATLGRHLNMEEAFVAMCYALRASNGYLERLYLSGLDDFGETGNVMAAREMLSGLAMKEAWAHLTPSEIAGMVAATMMDVMRFPAYGDRVFENCGMGGDRGVQFNGEPFRRKTINGSTLSTLVLATLRIIQTAKHGSYANTSAVGSTDAIEHLGVRVDLPNVGVQNRLAALGFHFTDAHAWKTIHDLSHAEPRRETVNHIVGPLTPPIHPDIELFKIVGVSEKMHPQIVAKALAVLGDEGVFRLKHAAAVCGLERVIDVEEVSVHERVRSVTVLDELSPIASAVAIVRNGEYCGTHILTPSMFGTAPFKNPLSVFVENTVERIMEANRTALSGVDDGRDLVPFLAMNAAFSLYLVDCLTDDPVSETRPPSRDALSTCYQRCLDVLQSGRVKQFVDGYAERSQTIQD